jgi:hypothetical protein
VDRLEKCNENRELDLAMATFHVIEAYDLQYRVVTPAYSGDHCLPVDRPIPCQPGNTHVYIDFCGDEAFYVGIGTLDRIKDPQRNDVHTQLKQNLDSSEIVTRKVVARGYTRSDAELLETRLIKKFGRRNAENGPLTNQNNGVGDEDRYEQRIAATEESRRKADYAEAVNAVMQEGRRIICESLKDSNVQKVLDAANQANAEQTEAGRQAVDITKMVRDYHSGAIATDQSLAGLAEYLSQNTALNQRQASIVQDAVSKISRSKARETSDKQLNNLLDRLKNGAIKDSDKVLVKQRLLDLITKGAFTYDTVADALRLAFGFDKAEREREERERAEAEARLQAEREQLEKNVAIVREGAINRQQDDYCLKIAWWLFGLSLVAGYLIVGQVWGPRGVGFLVFMGLHVLPIFLHFGACYGIARLFSSLSFRPTELSQEEIEREVKSLRDRRAISR